MSLLTEEVRAWIGREAVYEAPEEIGHAAIRYFALAVGDENSLYTDDEYARAHGYPGVIAPPTFVCESNQFLRGPRDEDGYMGHRWDLPVRGCRVLRGGNEYEFARPVLPTDRVTVRWRLDSIDQRSTSDGDPMLVVLSVVTYTNQDGELLAHNRETLIYRKADDEGG